jgi:hypothetical protein
VRFLFTGRTYGRGCGVGRVRGVTLGLAVGVGVTVAVVVGVAVGVTVGVTVVLGVAVAVAVGVGLAAPAQYLPPVFRKNGPRSLSPPHTIISLALQTAV